MVAFAVHVSIQAADEAVHVLDACIVRDDVEDILNVFMKRLRVGEAECGELAMELVPLVLCRQWRDEKDWAGGIFERSTLCGCEDEAGIFERHGATVGHAQWSRKTKFWIPGTQLHQEELRGPDAA